MGSLKGASAPTMSGGVNLLQPAPLGLGDKIDLQFEYQAGVGGFKGSFCAEVWAEWLEVESATLVSTGGVSTTLPVVDGVVETDVDLPTGETGVVTIRVCVSDWPAHCKAWVFTPVAELKDEEGETEVTTKLPPICAGDPDALPLGATEGKPSNDALVNALLCNMNEADFCRLTDEINNGLTLITLIENTAEMIQLTKDLIAQGIATMGDEDPEEAP